MTQDQDATPVSGADVQAQAEAQVREDACIEGCDTCLPVQNGTTQWQSYQNDSTRDPRKSRVKAAEYQSFVTGLPHDAALQRSLEWTLDGYAWDGIESPTCTLLEAKHGYYEGYLRDDWGGAAPVPMDWVAAAGIFPRMLRQARSQVDKLQAYKPEAKLHWCFSRQRPSIYFIHLINRANMTEPTVRWIPKPGDI